MNGLSNYIGFKVNIQVETVVGMKCSVEYEIFFLKVITIIFE